MPAESTGMAQYQDFSLKIEPKRGDTYPVIVLRSPAGEGRSAFELPFDPDKIGDILFDLGQTVRSSSRLPLRDISAGATRTRPQQIGDQLFDALFTGPVRSLLDRSLGMIHGSQRGLRIKLHIDPEDPSLAQLASLPWELMYRKETRDFLNLSRFTPILRYLDVQRPYVPLPLELPLRILVVISSPENYAQLDLDRERQLIEESWARQEGVEVEFMEDATILALQDRLAARPYHVLHYMGHGDFDRHTGQGVLLMEDGRGRGAMVDGSTLGILLRDLPAMRLVFLNACETARVTKQTGLDPFAGVAAAMVMAGIPAVVAMQFPITDEAAITFSRRFYPLLAQGEPVDYAVAEGRRAIRLAGGQTMEWATPVLFMRAPEGVVFRLSEALPARRPPPPELPELDDETEKRLEQLYTTGLSAFWLEEWDRAVRHFQAIVDVRPDFQDSAAKLAESKRRQKLDELYGRAQAAQEIEDWAGALAALEELMSEQANFRDAAAQLENVRKQKRLADLYAEAQRLHKAQQWPAVVKIFARIAALDPGYADPDGLLPLAQQKVVEQERQAQLDDLYSRALRELDAGRWEGSRQLLLQVQELEPDFRETDRLLKRVGAEIAIEEAEHQRQEQIVALYEQAIGWASVGQWQQALGKMDEIQALSPEFSDPQGLAQRAREEAERQQRLEALYEQAVAAQEDEDWPSALVALETLIAEAPNFEDAASLLEKARQQKELSDLYAQAQRHQEAGEWQAVLDAFAQIATIKPDYADPLGLQAAARRAIAAQERQAELDDLYGRARQEIDAGHWTEAHRLLTLVYEREAGFRDTAALLAQTQAEMERAEAERQRQERIAILYDEAQSLTRARQWRPALRKMGELQALDPTFDDAEGIAAQAEAAVAQEEAEARRQNELATLYAEAVSLVKAGQYQDALEKWSQVQSLDPRYPDQKKVQATARKKLDQLARPRTERRLPRTALLALGGLAVIAVVAAVVLLRVGIGGVPSGATPTRTRAATNTPRPTSTSQPATPHPTSELPYPVSNILSGARVLYHDDFDRLLPTRWEYDSSYVKASDGLVEIAGPGTSSDTTLSQAWGNPLNENGGMLILFKYDAGEGATFFNLGSEGEGAEDWREWDINGDFLDTFYTKGTSTIVHEGPPSGNLTAKPNTWYYLLLAIGKDGEIVAKAWERDDPSQTVEYRRTFGEDWAGRDWQLWIEAYGDTKMYLDSFTTISFSEVRDTSSDGEALPSPVSDILTDASVLYHDDFDYLSPDLWGYRGGYVKASDGLVEITGTPQMKTYLEGGPPINEGEGILVLFNPDLGAYFEVFLDSGEWETPEYKRWGIYAFEDSLKMNISAGKTLLGGDLFDGSLTIEPGKWYYLLLAVDQDAQFAARIWERNDPSQSADYRKDFEQAWAGHDWGFTIQAEENKLYVDSYTQVAFSDILGSETSGDAPSATTIDESCQSHTEGGAIKVPWLKINVELDGKTTGTEEWSDAVCLSMTLREPSWTEGEDTILSHWWLKNDAEWLYLLARVPLDSLNYGASASGYGAYINQFWPEWSAEHGWPHSDGGSINQLGESRDQYGWDEKTWYTDIEASPPGENNVEGTLNEGATYAWFEFRKALDSGDGYDWSWKPGQTVDVGETMLGVWFDDSLGAWTYVQLHLGSAQE